jgi:hypothetical protein
MQQQTIKVNRFQGLDISDAPGRIPDTELIQCQNWNLGLYGELVKRTGLVSKTNIGFPSTPTTIIGYLVTTTLNQIIARTGNQLYYSSDGATTWTLIGTYNNIEYGVQYNNIFYMVRRDDIMVQWDGTTASTIAGSPTGTACLIFKEMLVVINSFSTTIPSRVLFSFPFHPEQWTYNFIDIRVGDGDVLTAIGVLHDVLHVFKQESTWAIYPAADLTAWTVRTVSPAIGCVSRYAPMEVEGFLYFVGPRGFYRTDGYNFTELSMPLRDIFRKQSTGLQSVNQVPVVWWEDKIIMILQIFSNPPTWDSWATRTWDSLATTPWDSSTGATYYWFVYHIRLNQWSQWVPAPSANMIVSNMLAVQGPVSPRGIYFGSRQNDNKVWRYGDPVYQDSGQNYDCIVETKDLDFDEPTFVKRGMWIGVEALAFNNTTFYNIPDNSQGPAQIIPFGGFRNTFRTPTSGFFRAWRAKWVYTQNNPCTFYGFEICMTPRRKTLLGN